MVESVRLRPVLGQEADFEQPSIAVLVPCCNEEKTIAKVVQDFWTALPNAVIYICDNNSKDGTIRAAEEAGAMVSQEPLQGKGHAVRRMFADIDADVYVIVDGDDTYDAAAAPQMVEACLYGGRDMVVGRRVDTETAAYRPMHRFGNVMLTEWVAALFGKRFSDMLSGYRVFSRRFVKSFPVLSRGFEIETEMTVHALKLRMPIQEIDTHYRSRPEGSVSKLNTYRDGIKIIRMIFDLVREERPLLFFTVVSAILALISGALAYPIIIEFLRTGLVPRFPTAILATGIALLSALSLACAFILDPVTRARRAATMLAYLAIPRWKATKAR